jgi:hypothetical protein
LSQDEAKPFGMSSLDTGFAARLEKPAQPPVLEPADHVNNCNLIRYGAQGPPWQSFSSQPLAVPVSMKNIPAELCIHAARFSDWVRLTVEYADQHSSHEKPASRRGILA